MTTHAVTLPNTKLDKAFREKSASGKKFLVAYVTAGLPSPQQFVQLISDLAESCDAIEVGIPFSDPVMDGPIIQQASTVAIEEGVTVEKSFNLIREALRYVKVPVLVMTYFNPVHRTGLEEFVEAAAGAGVMGLIVPDLPYEESGGLRLLLGERGLAHVELVAPTTSPERAKMLAAASTGFVYAVSRMGVTGEQQSLAASARAVVDKIKPFAKVPVFLGIGISDPHQAVEATTVADGVIVGSAVMRHVLAGDTGAAANLMREMRFQLAQSAR